MPASIASPASTVTQSSDWQAGTTPRVLQRPRVGFRPTSPLNAAGTRPDPAVAVPRANATRPAATATGDPNPEPPLTYSRLNTQRGAPYGLRVPTRPVAN